MMLSRVRPTRIITAAALGLPSALLAHALVFGREHAAAGAMSTAVLAGACFAFLVVTALCAQRVAAQGSVIGARMRALLPSIPFVAASGSLWFAVIESLETPHETFTLISVIALIVAAAVVQLAVRAFGEFLAGTVLALRAFCVTAERVLTHAVHAQHVIIAVSTAHTGRRFSRPPPALS